MRKPEQIYSSDLVRDMTVSAADLLKKRIDALWRPPDKDGDRLPADRETDLVAAVAINAIAEDIEAVIGDADNARFVVDTGSEEMILRPKIMKANVLIPWRVLTVFNAGLPLRTCEECGALYAPPNRRPTNFCSTRCRNAHGIRAHRAREKAKQEKPNGEN